MAKEEGTDRATYFSNPSEGTTHRWDKTPKREDILCLRTVSVHSYWLLQVSNKSTRSPKATLKLQT